MKYTENYNLKKPEAEDFYNVEDFNENMEVIDGKLKDLEDNKETPAGAQAKADAAESAAKSYTDTHENKTSTHGMTATPTASRGAMYDSGKRLSSGAAPSNDNHVVRKVDLDSHINSDSAHSATATPTANRIAMYDSGKRLSSGAAPSFDEHVVRKVDLDSHINSDSAHSATPLPTASRIAMYDMSARLRSGAAPSFDEHVVRKVDLDNHVNSVSAHSATPTPTASRIAMYDSAKRLSSGAAPSNDNHVIRKIDIDNVETVNFTYGQAYVIRNFVHLYISGGGGVEGELVTILPSNVRPITPICGVAFTSSPGTPFGSTSKLFSIGTDGSVYCYDKSTTEDVYISAFYIKG